MVLVSFIILLPLINNFLFAETPAAFYVQTDKTQYDRDARISVIINNAYSTNLYSIAGSSTPEFGIEYIEKKSPYGYWERLDVRCSWPECDIDFDPPVEIKSGKSMFSWQPQFHVNGEGVKNRPLEPGTYRIIVGFQLREGSDSKKWEWLRSPTNEFVID